MDQIRCAERSNWSIRDSSSLGRGKASLAFNLLISLVVDFFFPPELNSVLGAEKWVPVQPKTSRPSGEEQALCKSKSPFIVKVQLCLAALLERAGSRASQSCSEFQGAFSGEEENSNCGE